MNNDTLKALRIVNPNIISQISYRVGDSQYNDFNKENYEEALLFANKEIAKTYNILKRSFVFTNRKNEEIKLNIPSFRAEYRVLVEGNEYEKVSPEDFQSDSDKYHYYLTQDQNQYLFNYTNKSDNDNVLILYTADIEIDDYDLDETVPMIPSKYKQEQIAKAAVSIAELGIVRFTGEKLEQYNRVLMLYKPKSYKDTDNEENRAWISIEPFTKRFP